MNTENNISDDRTDEISDDRKKEILCRAEIITYYCDLIIKKCDDWMPSEEADANLMREIMERHKTMTPAKLTGLPRFLNSIQKFKNSTIQRFNNSNPQTSWGQQFDNSIFNKSILKQ